MKKVFIISLVVLLVVSQFGCKKNYYNPDSNNTSDLSGESAELSVDSEGDTSSDTSESTTSGESVGESNTSKSVTSSPASTSKTISSSSSTSAVPTSKPTKAPSPTPKPTKSADPDTLVIPKQNNISYSINPIPQSSHAIGAADIEVHTGNITTQDQEDIYSFTPPRDGTYRFQLNNMMASAEVELLVRDNFGEALEWTSFGETNPGLTISDMKAGVKYQIEIEQYRSTTSYELSIGKQKPIIDVSAYTKITDSTEFTDQYNTYTFTPQINGTYRFQISKMIASAEVDLLVRDNFGEALEWTSFGETNPGLTIDGMKAGVEYQIEIEQYINYSDYELYIGLQKPIVDISSYKKVKDSVEYTDQVNIYTFIPSKDGKYRFLLSNVINAKVYLGIYDNLGKQLERKWSFSDQIEIILSGMKKGVKYEILVEQDRKTTDYELSFGIQ